MSFRTRLTSFFIVIVMLPMVGVGLLVFRLIGDSEQGKADARTNGLATAAASIYTSEQAAASADAQSIARDAVQFMGRSRRARLSTFATRAGLVRVRLSAGSTVITDVGDRSAVAPGLATVERRGGRAPIIVTVSTITASQFARSLVGPGAAVVMRQGGRTLSSTLALAPPQGAFPKLGTVTVAGVRYRAVTQAFAGFGDPVVDVSVLSNLAATATPLGASRLVAAIFIVGFLLLAFSFSVLASRALQGQLGRFLRAARRLGGGDFSSPIPTEGHDEFAALGVEFNKMSSQLAHRLDELSEERARLRESIRRIGQTFAANLDRPALLELALRTAVDATRASCGRVSLRSASADPLVETHRMGALNGLEERFHDAERAALTADGLGEAGSEQSSVASVALGPLAPRGGARGLITVGRHGRTFSDDDREVLRSLASEATLALENVELHFQVRRQAITDELTGLANHGHFQDLLSAEIEQVRRYRHPVGLIMLDIDDFKSVNDTHGHQQGDVVLKQVAQVLRETSREADSAARYGGEEMALILPHTDLEGSYAIAERARRSIEALRIPRLDQHGVLRITASVGVVASSDGDKDGLIADADRALYTAKRQGKNRTETAQAQTANVFDGE